MNSALRGIIPDSGLKFVAQQKAFLKSGQRMNVAAAGRRSGKTMTGKLRGRKRALTIPYENGRVIFAAPTHKQARRVFWKDVRRMFKPFTVGKPKDGDMSLMLVNGVEVEVMGLDVPERAEGAPLDHIQLDEYANMRPEVWTDHIRPMLAERNGTADLTGTPEGRNHYYELFIEALKDEHWGAFTWTSEEILPPDEIERLKKDLDELTYQQEICASFVNFEGRAYYSFDIEKHVKVTEYDPRAPIALCMDFNAKPGTSSVIQEHPVLGTMIIAEIFINRYSNTPEVCKYFLEKFRNHKGDVLLFGDPAGNQRKSSNVRGTDWDLVRQELQPVFGSRLKWRVDKSPPSIRGSVNAVNARLSQGKMCVHPACEWMIKDLDGTERDETGDIVKKQGDLLTHLTDGVRYYIARTWPIVRVTSNQTSIM